MLNKVIIKGYKSIKDLELPLQGINILIGANGSGKTNLLSFFNFLQQICSQNLKGYTALNGGVDKFLYQGRKVTDEIQGKLEFPKNAYSFTLKAGEDSFIFTHEGLIYENDVRDFSPQKEEAIVTFNDSYRANYIRTYLNSFTKFHFHDTGRNSPFTKTSNIENDTLGLYPSGSNLAATLYAIKEKHFKTYIIILKTIQSIAPYFKDFVLKPDDNGNISLKWQDKYSPEIYGVTNFSDGTIRFIALTVLFLLPSERSHTIILDEPELGLHPKAIAKVAALIKSSASKGHQILVATQSADFISHFKAGDVITVDQIDGESRFVRLSEEEISQWLEDFYSIGDLWKQNIITTGQPQ